MTASRTPPDIDRCASTHVPAVELLNRSIAAPGTPFPRSASADTIYWDLPPSTAVVHSAITGCGRDRHGRAVSTTGPSKGTTP